MGNISLWIIVVSVTLGSVVLGLILMNLFNMRPITKEIAKIRLERLLLQQVNKNNTVSGALLHVESGQKKFSYTHATGEAYGQPMKVNQPFHVASIGKTFTATLIAMLVDEKRFSFDDPVVNYLSADLLKGLFVFKGVDYKEKVTIRSLLNHTSGVADYFEDKGLKHESIKEQVMRQRDHFFSPEELVRYTSEYQKAVGMPGQKYHYSDTGYILLGLLIEAVTGESFHYNLMERIFRPLNMEQTYLHLYQDPIGEKLAIAPVWLDKQEISQYQSLSVDWAGGGLISTLDDLAVFIKAFFRGNLITEATRNEMLCFEHKFTVGIHYGLGIMKYEFGEYFPTLKGLPKLQGHMGILGTQMLYDTETDTTYICSFGSSDYSSESVRTMIKVLNDVWRIKERV